MKNRIFKIAILVFIVSIQSLLFQNCSKVQFSDIASPTQAIATREPSVEAAAIAVKDIRSRNAVLDSQITKVDLLLIIDNSGSMKEDSLALAGKLSEFFTYLSDSKIDWQMCLASTSLNTQGKSYDWKGGASGKVLNKQTLNIQTVVTESVSYLFGLTGTSDERGIAQSYKHLINLENKNCYRDGASFVSIIISDEDERSAGEVDYSAKVPRPININTLSGPIEQIDRPEFYLSEFKSRHPNKNIQSHSIVIPSTDESCFAAQDKFSKVSFGKFYEKLSGLTSGTTTSICEVNYSNNIKTISESIKDLSQKIQLDCVPTESPIVKVDPADSVVSYTLTDNLISFNYPSNKSYSVSVSYSCN